MSFLAAIGLVIFAFFVYQSIWSPDFWDWLTAGNQRHRDKLGSAKRTATGFLMFFFAPFITYLFVRWMPMTLGYLPILALYWIGLYLVYNRHEVHKRLKRLDDELRASREAERNRQLELERQENVELEKKELAEISAIKEAWWNESEAERQRKQQAHEQEVERFLTQVGGHKDPFFAD